MMNNNDDDFDFSLYEPVGESRNRKNTEEKKPTKSQSIDDDDDFSFALYEPVESKPTKEKSKSAEAIASQYKVAEKTKEQTKNMNLQERVQFSQDINREREYLQSAGLTKGFLSGATLGATKNIDALNPQENEIGAGFGEFIGEAAPLAIGGALLSIPLKAIPTAFKWGRRAYKTGAATLLGSSLEASKEAIAGEDLNPLKIGGTGLAFGLLDVLVRGGVKGYQWYKSLNPAQQAEVVTKNVIPENLSPTSYRKYQDEIVPEIQKQAEQQYAQLYEEAVKEAQTKFNQQLANTQAEHEHDLYKLSQKKDASQQQVEKSQSDYENKLRHIAAEHESEMQAIEQSNEQVMKEYETSKQQFENIKRRDRLVENALAQPKNEPADLSGRVSQQGQDIGIRPQASQAANIDLQDRVGNSISNRKITNTYDAGVNNARAVQATDTADYAVVRDLYRQAEEANRGISSEHPQLANQLRSTIENINQIPDPSPPQKQLRDTAERILAQIDGKEVSNEVLLEQAKALRYHMDYTFQHANPTGIFTPTVNALEDAAQAAAISSGNEAAVESTRAAKNGYRAWAEVYQNDLIRKYRDTTNHQFSKTFENSLNIDDFIQLNQVLSRTNAGQQLSNQTRRELISKKLAPFLENPRNGDIKKFNAALSELAPVISPQESRFIRNQYIEARRTSYIPAKKIIKPEEPKTPKTKTIEKVNIPLAKEPKVQGAEIDLVKLPSQKPVKESAEMKNALKMANITESQSKRLMNTPAGVKEMRKRLSGSEKGKAIFEDAGKEKVKEILFGNQVKTKYSGSELFKNLNKAENFDVVSEIIGEDAALELLNAYEKIGAQEATRETLKKYIKKGATIKAVTLFGLL